jgi:hypothetical protein
MVQSKLEPKLGFSPEQVPRLLVDKIGINTWVALGSQQRNIATTNLDRIVMA